MSSTPAPEPPAPQTLSEFQQQLAAQVLAAMKSQSDAILAAVQEQQAKFEQQTADLMQALRMPWPHAPSGGSGQPQAGQPKPAAPAGPT